jgi:hypothetical protein
MMMLRAPDRHGRAPQSQARDLTPWLDAKSVEELILQPGKPFER